MFFDKSERACNGPLSSVVEPQSDESEVTTTSRNVPPKQPIGTGKPRFKAQEAALLGPGTYYQETTLIKPTFNKLMSEHPDLRKSAEKSDCDEGFSVSKGRSTLSERRALKSSLQDLLGKSAKLDIMQTEIEHHHTEEIKVQGELKANRKKLSTLRSEPS